MVYLDSGCNKMILPSKKHLKNLQRVDRQMATAKKSKLIITSIGDASNSKNAPEGKKTHVDMKSTVIFDEDKVVIRHRSTGKTFIRQRGIDGYIVTLT